MLLTIKWINVILICHLMPNMILGYEKNKQKTKQTWSGGVLGWWVAMGFFWGEISVSKFDRTIFSVSDMNMTHFRCSSLRSENFFILTPLRLLYKETKNLNITLKIRLTLDRKKNPSVITTNILLRWLVTS